MRIQSKSRQPRRWSWQLAILLAGSATMFAATNVPPTAVVLSAGQRPGTTFMDIEFRVDDPDNATVSVAALGFVNGGTDFSSIVKISTLLEGTATNLGMSVLANTNRHLTWNVGADWNTNFGSLQVQIMANDGRSLLPFNWVTLPAHGSDAELTLNDRPIYDPDLLPVWYWLIATHDSGLVVSNGVIYGVSGDYEGDALANGTATAPMGRGYLGLKLGFRPAYPTEINRAAAGPYGSQTVFQTFDSYSVTKGYQPPKNRIYGWGYGGSGQLDLLAANWMDIRALALGAVCTLALLADGTVAGWGGYGTIPANATNVIAIAAGLNHNLALRTDGLVIAWGDNTYGQLNIPASATNVVAIATGWNYSLALRADGTVVGWGPDPFREVRIPTNAANVTAIATGQAESWALRADSTVIGWNNNVIAANVTAIAMGRSRGLMQLADGTVGYEGWGPEIPLNATNVTAIAAGEAHYVALRADGTVVVWGSYPELLKVPAGLTGIDLLGVGGSANHVVVLDKRTP